MKYIELRKDAIIVRDQLIKRLAEIAKTDSAQPVSAIEVGYECFSGWVVIHETRQENYQPRGEWESRPTRDDELLMPHWGDFCDEYLGPHEFTVTRVDGSSFVCPASDVNQRTEVERIVTYDWDEESYDALDDTSDLDGERKDELELDDLYDVDDGWQDETDYAYELDNEHQDGPDYVALFIEAVGEMLVSVMLTAASEKLFSAIGAPGTIQLVVEELDYEWVWPSDDDGSITFNARPSFRIVDDFAYHEEKISGRGCD